MTSKLRRTIVGVGIALGGAAPACFGRTDVLSDFPTPGEGDDETELAPDDGVPDPGQPDATNDDATGTPIDPFCDVSWPPTKGNQFSGPVACVDPLHECTGKRLPYQCIRLIEPYVCDFRETRVGPLYCIGGEWRCPPGTDPGARCRCSGPLEPGKTCTDAGPI
jgi:hypothetical protein